MKVLINMQGQIFKTEQEAIEYYGARFETAILEEVEINEDGEVV